MLILSSPQSLRLHCLILFENAENLPRFCMEPSAENVSAYTNTSQTNTTPCDYFHMNICVQPFTVPANHFLFEKLLKNFCKRVDIPLQALAYEHFAYDLYLLRTLSDTNICRRTHAYEPFAIRTFPLTDLPMRTVCIRTF